MIKISKLIELFKEESCSNKVEVQTICGYSIEEAIQILSAVTMSKIDVEWPPGGKEITIRKVDAEALEDYR